jgi:hypothetical protein
LRVALRSAMQVDLLPFPLTPVGPVEGIRVELERDGVLLWLRFVAEGNVDGIAWPDAAEPGRADDLWRSTCFEAFARTKAGYREYNLSPSGAWASYRFDGYREGMTAAEEVATVAGMDAGPDYVALEGRIELPADADRLALAVVVEATDGSMSYWALAHPSAKADFHHPDSFVLELP